MQNSLKVVFEIFIRSCTIIKRIQRIFFYIKTAHKLVGHISTSLFVQSKAVQGPVLN